MAESRTPFDALLIVSFGGPEKPDDVMPFLERVVQGRRVPRERLLSVAEHYHHFGGRSPINDQNRALIAALTAELAANGPSLPIYWGNRNWHPFLADELRRMAAAGVRRCLAFVTSAFSSYSGCRQYREDLAAASAEAGVSIEFAKLRVFYNHPRYLQVVGERVAAALETLPAELCGDARLVFTAHSIPLAMAEGCNYEKQLREASRLVAEKQGHPWDLVFQSRSGAPNQPWLEPDVCDHLKSLAAGGTKAAVAVPIGFVSDHMEVVFDLDHEAKEAAAESGLAFARAGTAGTHPEFVRMIRELMLERIDDQTPRRAEGAFGPSHDVCPAFCCRPGGDRPLLPAVSQEPAPGGD